MYLTSFIHRDRLFEIVERWICGRPEPDDIEHFTEILICDGFVLGEILKSFSGYLLETILGTPYKRRRIHYKGELRDVLSLKPTDRTPK